MGILKREDTDQIIILTGATGFLGSHLMSAWLKRGLRLIVLGRSAGKESLRERLRKRLIWFGMEACIEQLDCCEIDWLKPRFGLPDKRYHDLCSMSARIIHCASDTSFLECDHERIMDANIHSLNEILEFASRSHAPFFHYVSTVYAVGLTDQLCSEAISRSDRFNNAYEATKARAEAIIASRCRENGIPYTILRTSIVHGDSQTGEALRFNALYYPVRSLLAIRDIYLKDIRLHRGIKSKSWEINLDGDGFLYLPLRIVLPQDGLINLIPVNYFVDCVTKIVDTPSPGTVYHIAGRVPVSTRTLVEYTRRYLKLKGVEVICGEAGTIGKRNPPEELFDLFIQPYRPYLSDTRVFEIKNVSELTGDCMSPVFTYDIFKRCMDYAVSVEWGKSLFNPKPIVRKN